MLKEKLENIIQEIYQPIKEIIDDKNSKKYFIYLVIIYLIGYASILITDVYYLDDLARAMNGGRWANNSRHLSDKGSILVHMQTKISDISPLGQLIVILILSTSSLLLTKIINNKLTFITILASTCIGLFPYFLANFSYKFDSPYMAFSVLSSVLPFIYFRSNKTLFVVFSVFGILGTFMTYQAAGGVYLVLFIALLTKDFLTQHKNLKQSLISICLLIGVYTFSTLIYKYFFVSESLIIHYASSKVFNINELPNGIYYNLKKYISSVIYSFGHGFIAYGLLFLVFWYFVKLFLLSKQPKITTLLVGILSFSLMLCLSWGVYIVLLKPVFAARAYLGFCFLIALLAVIGVEQNKIIKYINRIFIGAFVYSLIVFANAYGNALKAQAEYDNFRIEMAVHDLSKFISPEERTNKIKLQFLGVTDRGKFNPSPVVLNAAHYYPLMKWLVPKKGEWVRHLTMRYLGMPTIGRRQTNKVCAKNVDKTILYSTAFHDIAKAKESDCYYIIFK